MFQNKANIEIIKFKVTYFGFALDLSDMDLWKIDLLDTHLDFLDTDITSKHFVCLQEVLKTSSRYVFKTPSRHVFKTSSRHFFKTSWRRLQRNNFSSSKASSRRLEDVFKTPCERSCKTVTLKTCWRSTNVCWEGVFKFVFLIRTFLKTNINLMYGSF